LSSSVLRNVGLFDLTLPDEKALGALLETTCDSRPYRIIKDLSSEREWANDCRKIRRSELLAGEEDPIILGI